MPETDPGSRPAIDPETGAVDTGGDQPDVETMSREELEREKLAREVELQRKQLASEQEKEELREKKKELAEKKKQDDETRIKKAKEQLEAIQEGKVKAEQRRREEMSPVGRAYEDAKSFGNEQVDRMANWWEDLGESDRMRQNPSARAAAKGAKTVAGFGVGAGVIAFGAALKIPSFVAKKTFRKVDKFATALMNWGLRDLWKIPEDSIRILPFLDNVEFGGDAPQVKSVEKAEEEKEKKKKEEAEKKAKQKQAGDKKKKK